MARRKKNRGRRSSYSKHLLDDTVDIASVLPWYASLLFGLVFFCVCYWLFPGLIISNLENTKGVIPKSAWLEILAPRLQWFKGTGITILLICVFFAVRDYAKSRYLTNEEKDGLSILARFIAWCLK